MSPQDREKEARIKEDAIIVAQVKAGDWQAFGKLLVKYQREIYSYCFRMLQDEQGAEDTAQEAFVKAFVNILRLKENHKFKSWLYTIARNRCLDELKKRKRFVETSVEDIPFSSPKKSPEEVVLMKEQAAAVEKAISDLDPKCQEIIILIHYQRLKYKEAAKILNILENTTKTRMRRCLEKLRDKLKE